MTWNTLSLTPLCYSIVLHATVATRRLKRVRLCLSFYGPLLFAPYSNDIQYVVGAEGVWLFANATAIHIVSSDLQILLSAIKEKNIFFFTNGVFATN